MAHVVAVPAVRGSAGSGTWSGSPPASYHTTSPQKTTSDVLAVQVLGVHLIAVVPLVLVGLSAIIVSRPVQ